MEELTEGTFKGILRLIRFILIDFFCELVAYWVGRITLYLMTLGKYPKEPESQKETEWITVFGVFVIFLLVVAISFLI